LKSRWKITQQNKSVAGLSRFNRSAPRHTGQRWLSFIVSAALAYQVLKHLGSRRIDKPSHHIGPNCRHCELGSLFFRKIENALAKLLKYAAVMCEACHRASLDHCPLIAKFAAYRT
jgi:hypothetical protein